MGRDGPLPSVPLHQVETSPETASLHAAPGWVAWGAVLLQMGLGSGYASCALPHRAVKGDGGFLWTPGSDAAEAGPPELPTEEGEKCGSWSTPGSTGMGVRGAPTEVDRGGAPCPFSCRHLQDDASSFILQDHILGGRWELCPAWPKLA